MLAVSGHKAAAAHGWLHRPYNYTREERAQLAGQRRATPSTDTAAGPADSPYKRRLAPAATLERD